MEGVINLDKPVGPSSARAVGQIKKLIMPTAKVGHAGTLDPFASGVLLILIGKATRLAESLMDQPKQYLATVKFGASTATDDLQSPEIVWPDAQPPTGQAVAVALEAFVGIVLQRPPAFSALKVGGRRAYKLARSGRPPTLAPRPVRIDSIQLLNYQWPVLKLLINCGRGTYIRSIARDLGEQLCVGGYLTELRRTRVGPFTAVEAVPLATVIERGPAAFVQPAFAPIPAVSIIRPAADPGI